MAASARGAGRTTGTTYDVVVVGAGSAGEVVAARLGDAGVPVALVGRSHDSRGGCERWAGRGVTPVRGTGRLAGERVVEVDGERLVARRAVVLATGARPVMPPVPGLAGVRPWDASAPTVPRSLVVLGGDPAGLELAQAVKRRGAASVVVLDAAGSLLPQEERFAGEEVRAALESEGVVVAVAARVQGVARTGTDGPVRVDVAGGRTFVADEVAVAAGSAADTSGLGLESVGLGTAGAGPALAVDDTFAVPRVAGGWLYAVGACTGRAAGPHVARYQARVVSDVLVGRPARDRAADVVPRLVRTDPPVAAVGLTAAQARDRGISVTVLEHRAPRPVATGSSRPGTSRLVVDDAADVVVGATFTGDGATELLHAATVAITGRVTLADLWHAVPVAGTASEAWVRLLETAGL